MRFSGLSLSLALLLPACVAAVSTPARAQNVLHNSEISLSAFGQYTGDVTGNGIADKPTRSVGGQAAFRHSYHWWLGYEASYGYTRYAERYSDQVFPIQHNTHEFGGSYLITGPSALGFRPFALAGVSALVFSPSLNGGQNVTYQARPAANFGVGVDKSLVTSHFGVRVQYRGLMYKTPDFGETVLATGAFRTTSEAMAGAYIHF